MKKIKQKMYLNYSAEESFFKMVLESCFMKTEALQETGNAS